MWQKEKYATIEAMAYRKILKATSEQQPVPSVEVPKTRTLRAGEENSNEDSLGRFMTGLNPTYARPPSMLQYSALPDLHGAGIITSSKPRVGDVRRKTKGLYVRKSRDL